MQDDDLRASDNVEDRRGMGGATKGGLGIGAIVVLSLIGWATGIDPRTLINGAEMVTGGIITMPMLVSALLTTRSTIRNGR